MDSTKDNFIKRPFWFYAIILVIELRSLLNSLQNSQLLFTLSSSKRVSKNIHCCQNRRDNTRNKNVVLFIDLTYSLKSIYGTEISFVTNRTTKKILAIVLKKILHIIQQTMLWIFCEIKMTIKLPSSISFISRSHVTWEVLSTPNVPFIYKYFILSFKIPYFF